MDESLAKDMQEIQPFESIGRILQFLADLHIEVDAQSKPATGISQGSLRSQAFVATIVPRLLSSHNLTAARLYEFTNWLQLVLKHSPTFEEPPSLDFAPARRKKVAVTTSRRRRPQEWEIEEVEDIEHGTASPRRRSRSRPRRGIVSGEFEPATNEPAHARSTGGVSPKSYEFQDHSQVPLAFQSRRKRTPNDLGEQEIEFDSAVGERPPHRARWQAKRGVASIAGGVAMGVAGMYLGSREGPSGLFQPLVGPPGPHGFGQPQLGISSQPLGRASSGLADSLILRNGARGSSGLSQDLLKMRTDPGPSNLNPNSAVSTHPRLGYVTLVSSPVRVSGKDSTKSGVDATFQMNDLAKGARPLTFDDIKNLKETLPAGAKALYPSLHPNDLGPSAVNVPISAEVINALLEHEGDVTPPGFAQSVVSLSWPSPVMSALRADLGPPDQQARLSSGPSTLGQGRTHRWSGNHYASGSGPSVLRSLGLPVYLPGGVNQPHSLSHSMEARADLRMVPVPSIPATSFAQMRQQAFPNFHSVIAKAPPSVLPRIMPSSGSASPTYHAPRVSMAPSHAPSSAVIASRSVAPGGGVPSRPSSGGLGHSAVPHIPARSASSVAPVAPRPPSLASGNALAKPSTKAAGSAPMGTSTPIVKPIVPSHPANLITPPTIGLPKAPPPIPHAPDVDVHLELPHTPKLDLGDQEKPKTTMISASLSKPAMPLKKPMPHDDQAIAVQASKGGMGSAVETPAKAEEQATQVGGAKAKDQDITLLATEVWSLLKRKLQFESERAGHR